MRGHIIRSLGCVDEQTIPIRDQSGHKSLQVDSNIRISVFLDQQGRGSMPNL